MSKDKRDMSIEEEFEKEYNTHLEELRSRGFTDNFLEMEKNGKWLLKTWFLRGYKCSQKELQEKLDAAIQIIKDLNPSCAHFDERSAQYRAVSFLKARGE